MNNLKQYIRQLRGEEGMAMVLALLVILVLGILGTVIAFAATTEGRQSVRYGDKTHAYYLARSGAEVARDWLEEEGHLDNVTSDSLNVKMSGDLNSGGLMSSENADAPIDVLIERDADNSIIVESTGRHNGLSQTVNLRFEVGASSIGGPFLGIDVDNNIWSFDGNSWTKVVESSDIGLKKNEDLNAIAWDGETIIAVGDNHNQALTYGSTGEWELIEQKGGGYNHAKEIVWVEERSSFFAVNHNGRIFKKGIGEDEWTLLENTNVGDNNRGLKIAYGDDMFVMVDEGRYIYYYDFNSDSHGRDDWNNAYEFMDVAYGDGVFIVVGKEDDGSLWEGHGLIYRSVNGTDWNVIWDDWHKNDSLNAVTWNGDYFFATGLGYAHVIYRSENGLDWDGIADWGTGGLEGTMRKMTNIESYGDIILATSEEPDLEEYGTNLLSIDGGNTWQHLDGEGIPKIKAIAVVEGDIAGVESYLDPIWY